MHRLLHRRGASFFSAVLTLGKQRLVRVSISEQFTVSPPQKTAPECAVGGEHGDSLGIAASEGSNAPCVTQQMAEDVQREQGRARTSSVWVVRAS